MSEYSSLNVNFPEVRNVQIAAETLQSLVANLSRDAESHIVGSGYLAQHQSRSNDANASRERTKRQGLDAYDKLVLQLQNRLSELQDELRELQSQEEALRNQLEEIETNMGGLEAMGSALGVTRLSDETDQNFRKRLKIEIDQKLNRGELDPYSPFAQWATHYDYLEDNLLAQARIQHGVDRIEKALHSGNEAALSQTLADVSPDALRSLELVELKPVSQIIDNELTDDNGQQSNIQTNSELSKMLNLSFD